MPKTAADLLSELDQRELVPPQIVASLRRQVAGAARPVSAVSIARLLVEKGHLTAVQAEKLLGVPLPPAKPAPSSLAETRPMDAELGLAPLQKAAAPVAASAAKPNKPADATTALEPLDLGLLDLMPLDEPAQQAAPARPAAAPQRPAAPLKKLPRARPPAASPLMPLEGLAPLEPLGGLQPLPSPLAPMPELSAPAPTVTAPLAPAAKRASTARKPSSRAWWIGGIAIGLVTLLGIGLTVALLLLRRDRGPGSLELAEQHYQAGQYAAAAEKYEAFLAAEPGDERAGLARVRRGMARMLAAKGNGDDWPAVLPVASEVLAEIDREQELPQVHGQLAPLLTDMAGALAELAEKASADDRAIRLEETRLALALADNGRYVPGALRDWQRLAAIGQSLAVLERNEEARQELDPFALSAQKELEAGDLAAFIARRDKFLAEFPQIAGDPQLAAIGADAAKVAALAVQSLTELPQAEAAERKSAAIASVTFIHPSDVTAPGPPGIFLARTGGTIWALDTARGTILWRRHVGSHLEPVALPDGGGDVLLVDGRQHELLRIDRRSGTLRWRHPLADPIAGPPLVAGDRIVATTTTGRVVALEPATGNAVAGCQLPLPAGSSAAADPQGKLLYQLADSDLLFVLSAEDLKARSAIDFGHQPRSILVPPITLPGRLVVAASGIDRAALHVLPLDDAGLPHGKSAAIDLAGLVLTPPLVLGDRLIVPADNGSLRLFKIPAGSGDPLTRFADLPADSAGAVLTFGLVAGSRLCTSGVGLAMFDPAAGEGLTGRWTRFDDESFSSPPQLIGDAILSVRQTSRSWVAAAVKVGDGAPLWETPLAVPLAELVASDDGAVRAVSSLGGSGAINAVDFAKTPIVELTAPRQMALVPSLACPPVKLAGGSLTIDTSGAVQWTSGDGSQRAGPFQLAMTAGEQLANCSAAVLGGSEPKVVISDGRNTLSLLVLRPEPQPILSLAAQTRLEETVISPIASIGDHVCLVTQDGNLQFFSGADLQPAALLPLAANAILSGPFAAGDAILLLTGRPELCCIAADGSLRWKTPLDSGLLAGSPIAAEGSFLVATMAGELLRLHADSGQELARIDVGQPLAGTPIMVGDEVLVPTADGAVLRIAVPAPGATR